VSGFHAEAGPPPYRHLDVSSECYEEILRQTAAAWSSPRRHGHWIEGPVEGAIEVANEYGFHPYALDGYDPEEP